MFYLKKILSAFLLPPGVFILIIILIGIFVYFKKRKTAISLIVILSLVVYSLSIEVISDLLIKPLENSFSPLNIENTDIKPLYLNGATAIVCLGGGTVQGVIEGNSIGALSRSSTKRALNAFKLSKKLNLPLYASGGIVYTNVKEKSEAEMFKEFWIELGVDANNIIVETESRDTKENAQNIRTLIEGKKIVLVTSAFHMKRAVTYFTKAGFNVIPAPCDYIAENSIYGIESYLPSVSYLFASYQALHEYAGLLAAAF